eukprot:CAMPEP_0204174050 /NCGR_PEP_ID=MMETSP0361-20130328/45524_1 /ASSEMBLY_ACC=CAM_ASM_000343 /TAXON_ID=268821 /ORGANISM="Scrippsiella Hangoei, Strain SHTV-5" /LENGTH=88 /DNA_ID=CAMNT_0051132441 /DNA_START=20 /DNA_END=282 /DNA_ORIENTATION=+
MPWRTFEANMLDIFFAACLIMLLIVGGPFVENAKAQQSGMFGVFLLCLICLGGFSIFGFAVYERFLRRGKPFQFFLCHHKAGAGNLAR